MILLLNMREKDFDLDTVLLTLARGSDLEEISTALQPFTSYTLAVENSSRLWVFPSLEHLPVLVPVSSNSRGRVYRSEDGRDLFLPSFCPPPADGRETFPPPPARKALSWKGDRKLPFWPKQTLVTKSEVERKKLEENKDSVGRAPDIAFSLPSKPQEKQHSVPPTATREGYRIPSTERTFPPKAGGKEYTESTWEIRNI